MAATDVEVVRVSLDLFNRRDPAWLDTLDPEVEIVPWRAAVEATVYRGLDGARRFLREVDEVWSEFRIEVEGITDEPRGVLILGRMVGRWRSGLTIDDPVGYVCEMRDGLCSRLVTYRDPNDARAAAGLADTDG